MFSAPQLFDEMLSAPQLFDEMLKNGEGGPTNLGIEPDPGTEGRRPRGDAMARRPRRRRSPPPPAGYPGDSHPADRRSRELDGPVRRADVEHQAKRGAGGGKEGSGPRKAGALRGGSYELSSRERGSVDVVVDVVPASAPMASTGTGSEGLEIRIDWIVAAGS
ncbi:unnamed protein product [Miscanthus lutarioriparius]|uniref:Uncharacterized protein n=1 Tax=Miscanthus lutarioriparius TaxID=422564 RepID=A0A811QFH4_9POAL|nr:unnamed protein product [Miscanthus lutarioriparius]